MQQYATICQSIHYRHARSDVLKGGFAARALFSLFSPPAELIIVSLALGLDTLVYVHTSCQHTIQLLAAISFSITGRAKLQVSTEAPGNTLEGLQGPVVEPINGGAVDKGGEHAQALPEGVTNRAEAQYQVQGCSDPAATHTCICIQRFSADLPCDIYHCQSELEHTATRHAFEQADTDTDARPMQEGARLTDAAPHSGMVMGQLDLGTSPGHKEAVYAHLCDGHARCCHDWAQAICNFFQVIRAQQVWHLPCRRMQHMQECVYSTAAQGQLICLLDAWPDREGHWAEQNRSCTSATAWAR